MALLFAYDTCQTDTWKLGGNWRKWGRQSGDTTCRRTQDGGIELNELESEYVIKEEENSAMSFCAIL